MAEIEIIPKGPFSWQRALEFLTGFQPTDHAEAGNDGVTRLGLLLDGSYAPYGAALRFEDGVLRAELAGCDDPDRARRQIARIFSLDVDATAYPAVGERDPDIGRLMAELPGLRPVLFFTPYECAAWAVISQRITMRQAGRVKNQLIADHGRPVSLGGSVVRGFPTPDRMLEIAAIPGLNPVKVERLHGIARAALEGRLDPDQLAALGCEAASRQLRQLPGIGDFWSQGIALRACSMATIFPEEPVSLRALAALKGLPASPSGAQLDRLVEPWQPFAMWVCVLLRVAAGRGLIPGVDAAQHREPRTHRLSGTAAS